MLGWSLLEGIGAALIMPAIVALVASNVAQPDAPAAYGLIAAAGAIAVAVGPLIGGAVTTLASWRYVFVGEVIIVIAILVMARRIQDIAADRATAPRLRRRHPVDPRPGHARLRRAAVERSGDG